MKLIVRFITLSGPIRTVGKKSFASTMDAIQAVRDYVEPLGFKNVRMIEEEDAYSVRFTAKTPNGRNGSNVAFGDFDPRDDY
jgi:hypothetical protein